MVVGSCKPGLRKINEVLSKNAAIGGDHGGTLGILPTPSIEFKVCLQWHMLRLAFTYI